MEGSFTKFNRQHVHACRHTRHDQTKLEFQSIFHFQITPGRSGQSGGRAKGVSRLTNYFQLILMIILKSLQLITMFYERQY